MKQHRDPSTKPYYRCLSCPRFRNTCGGRPTRGYDLQTWCEYIRDVRDAFGLKNANIARDADVSIKTIEKVIAINTEQDIMRATARRIELAVIGPVGDHTCYLDHEGGNDSERIGELLKEIEQLRERLRQIDDLHRRDIRAVKEEYQDQVDFLKDELKAWRDLHKNSR